MAIEDLTCRFRTRLEEAINHWNRGEEEYMIDFLRTVQGDGFVEGCDYMRDKVAELAERGVRAYGKTGRHKQ